MRVFVWVFVFVVLIGGVFALSVDVNILEENYRVAPGEEVVFDVNVFYPESVGERTLVLKYRVLDDEGRVVASADTLKNVDMQLFFADSLLVPDDVRFGTYYLDVEVRDGNSARGSSSVDFYVSRGGVNWTFIFSSVIGYALLIYFGLKLRYFLNRFLIRRKIKGIVRRRFGRGK